MMPRNLQSHEQPACIELWRSVWPDDSPGYFDRYFEDPDFVPEYTQVIEVDGRMVSAAHIVKRTARVGDLALTVGGIANVVTLPEYRGRGFARSVVSRAMEVMRWDAFDAALLFTGIPKLYEPTGFEIWPLANTLVSNPILTIEIPDVFTLRIANENDSQVLDTLFRNCHGLTPLSFHRSRAYRTCWTATRIREMHAVTHIAHEGGEPVGYVTVTVSDSVPRIVEWASINGDAAPLESLLRFRLSTLGTIEGTIEIANGKSEPMFTATRNVFATQETIELNDPMVASVDVSQWMVGLIPHLTDAWDSGGRPQGQVTVRDRFGAITLSTLAGVPRVLPVVPDSPEISGSRWVRLILGDKTAMPNADEPALAWLADVLPIRQGVFWECDAF